MSVLGARGPWQRLHLPQWGTLGYMTEMLDSRVNTRVPQRVKNDLAGLAQRRRVDESELARSLLDEGLRRENHPGIVFRTTSTGREAATEGRRLYIWQIVETVWANDGSVTDTADFLGLRVAEVEAALGYYADYGREIDQLIALNRQDTKRALQRQLRRQEARRP